MHNHPPLFPSHSGQNFAPLDPLLKVGEGQLKVSSDLQSAFQERFRHFLNLQRAVRNEMILAGEQVSLFHQGKQFLMPNPYIPNRWLPYTVDTPGEKERRALSIMQFHFTLGAEKWLNSNPDVEVFAGTDSDEAIEAAEGASLIVDHYEEKFYKSRLVMDEYLTGVCYGSYIWRVEVDPTQKTLTTYREIFENREIAMGRGWGKCGECPFGGTAEDFQEIPEEERFTCPKCGGDARVEPPATELVPTVVGREQVDLGDLSLRLVPFPACAWDYAKTVDESQWLIVQRRTSATAVRQVFGNIAMQGQASSNIGLDVIDRTAYSGQATGGKSAIGQESKSLYKEPVSVEEFWLSPDEYGDIKLQKPAKTVSGAEIPAGERLGDMFGGKNLCVLGLNEMATVLGIFVEDHRDYMTQGVWYSRQGSGAGRGQEDLVEVQKRINSGDQQISRYLRAGSTPALLYIAEALGEEGKSRYLGWPEENIPISMAALREGIKPSDVIAPAFNAPTGLLAQYGEYIFNRMNEQAQFASHAINFTSGIPGVNNETATGANITQEISNGLYLPPLSVKGEIRMRIAEIVVKLYPKVFPVDRYFPLGGKYGQQSGRVLNGANFCTDLMFRVVRDSQLPRNSFTKKQDYVAFFNLFGGMEGYVAALQAFPDRVADITRTFDLDIKSEERNTAASVAFKRMKQMERATQFIADPSMLIQQLEPPVVAQSVDPMTGMPTLGPSIEFIVEPGHMISAKWYRDWLVSDTGQEAPPVLRAASAQMAQLHFQAETMVNATMNAAQGMAQVAGAAPQALAQQAMQPEVPEPQVSPDAMLKVEADAQRMDAESANADRQREFEKEMAQIDHQNKLTQIKAQPKPRGKAA